MQSKAKDFIHSVLKQKDALPLSEFIDYILSHPEYGYYANCEPFGAQGDFITAPEISQMFGEMIGAWVIDSWMKMGRPDAFNLVECGAGRGTLMADILRVGAGIPEFLDAVQIRFIETSPKLKILQKQALNGVDASWHDCVAEINTDLPCLIIGNEFLDALSIEQVKRDAQGWTQCFVEAGENDSFSFTWKEADKALLSLLPSKTVSHEVYELSPARLAFIDQCAALLRQNVGAMLFVDYGYGQSHYGDTLQAVQNHQFSDVLEDVGQVDVTSHVDFDSLARQVRLNGLHATNCVTQGAFLKSLGIEYRALVLKNTALKNNTVEQAQLVHRDIDAALERLIGADQMGNLFKVICFYTDNKMSPAGF